MTETVGESADLTGRRWIFGRAVLDERSLELNVDGEQVTVERKPLEVLLYLLHHAGKVVTKDDLSESLWPGRLLTDTVLTRCISMLRTALKDDDRRVIRTARGFGYRLVAHVKVEASVGPGPPALEFKAGDSPPNRPQWRLAERLGIGGHGEAWLARHEKTGDARVFKFALNASALSSLKREITLYRLMRDTLGARAAIARILEWNLEEPPYFIEMEHVAGGNLLAWAEAQGGLAGVPLAVRLDLAAQTAEALAAAHSVGALHKDLKPANVLVQVDAGRPSIRLCDFGSGSVLDPGRLDALGITRLGFTKTMVRESATPLYIAPEVIAGQPFTVQADIYALGILLYQIVTGELRKMLAPGWEADIEDELLREDIAAAAAGDPQRRLIDATQLVERLRTLDQRREVRAAEAAARVRADRVRRIQEELRRTRGFAVVLCVLAAVAVTGGIVAYRARNEAVAATATAKAVGDFLMEDVFRMDSGLFRPSETSYLSLLDRAASEVGERLKGQPTAAASVHSLLGRRYQEIGRFETAMQHYERAVALYGDPHGPTAEAALIAQDRLAWIYLENGRAIDAAATSKRIRALWEARLPASSLAMLMVRIRAARVLLSIGDYNAAEQELRSILQAADNADPADERVVLLMRQWLGIDVAPEAAADILIAYGELLLGGGVLEESGDASEAQSRVQRSLATFTRILGGDAELVALSNSALAMTIVASGRTDGAEVLVMKAQQYFEKALPARHFAHALPKLALGRTRMEQGRFAEATAIFKDAADLCTSESGCPPRVRAEFFWDLGTALNEQGRGHAAVAIFRASLELQRTASSRDHVLTLKTEVGLAEALRQAANAKEAAAVLSSLSVKAIGDLRPTQQARADLRRTEGLLLLENGQSSDAAAALRECLEILTTRVGKEHWRTKRAVTELAVARAAGT